LKTGGKGVASIHKPLRPELEAEGLKALGLSKGLVNACLSGGPQLNVVQGRQAELSAELTPKFQP